MALGVSIILMAVGAVLLWAVEASVAGIDVNTLGLILLIVGLVGGVLSVLFWSPWGAYGGRDEERVVRHRH